VSTAGQKPDLQHDGLSAYAKRAGLEVIEIYCDVAVSGRREGRPQLNTLMTAARNYEIDCVLAWKLDRVACSTRHLLTALKEFNHLGVSFVSVQDQVDTDSPMGWAMFTIIGAMADDAESAVMRSDTTRNQELPGLRQCCAPHNSAAQKWPAVRAALP
jgi:DNA invertase Pin-like site-specific DNA recombinase